MIFLDFIKWYYYEAPLGIITIWRNFLAFPFDFFGIRYHLRTFFRPWHLIVVRFAGEERIKTFFFNLASRLIGSMVGMVARSVTIGMGLVTFATFFIFGLMIELFWLFLPFLLIYLVWQGFSYIV